MASPFLYHAHDRLSLTELCAARLDGDVVELGDAFMPADAVETAALRAGSLRRLLGDQLAATHLTAAWVHGALAHPPGRHTVQRSVSRRISAGFDRRVVYRDTAVPPGDLLRLGGVAVTTPPRTLVDLARVPDAEHADAARELAAQHPGLTTSALAHIARSRPFPRKRAAVALLERLAEVEGAAARVQEVVTRYTS